jgi:predicted transcriptional regulator
MNVIPKINELFDDLDIQVVMNSNVIKIDAYGDNLSLIVIHNTRQNPEQILEILNVDTIEDYEIIKRLLQVRNVNNEPVLFIQKMNITFAVAEKIFKNLTEIGLNDRTIVISTCRRSNLPGLSYIYSHSKVKISTLGSLFKLDNFTKNMLQNLIDGGVSAISKNSEDSTLELRIDHTPPIRIIVRTMNWEGSTGFYIIIRSDDDIFNDIWLRIEYNAYKNLSNNIFSQFVSPNLEDKFIDIMKENLSKKEHMVIFAMSEYDGKEFTIISYDVLCRVLQFLNDMHITIDNYNDSLVIIHDQNNVLKTLRIMKLLSQFDVNSLLKREIGIKAKRKHPYF